MLGEGRAWGRFAAPSSQPSRLRSRSRFRTPWRRIFALAALSLDLILGYGGLVSFGHAAFMGIGGYTVGILFHHDAMVTPIFGLPGTQVRVRGLAARDSAVGAVRAC